MTERKRPVNLVTLSDQTLLRRVRRQQRVIYELKGVPIEQRIYTSVSSLEALQRSSRMSPRQQLESHYMAYPAIIQDLRNKTAV